MPLKNPAQFFESNISEKEEEVLSQDKSNETFNRYKGNLDKVEQLKIKIDSIYEELNEGILNGKIDSISEQLENKISKEDLENAMFSHLMVVDENFKSIKEQVNGVNQRDLQEFKKIYNTYKNLSNILESKSIKNDEKIEEYSKILEDINFRLNDYKTSSLLNVETYIRTHRNDLVELKENVFSDIKNILDGDIRSNIKRVENKIDIIKEKYESIDTNVIVEEVIKEGLLNIPSNEKNSDELTPLDKNFVTFDQLQKHYTLFINRIQQQLSTLGGGGETQLKYLDDLVGIATNASAYDGKYLKYNHSIGKFEFTNVDISHDTWAEGEDGPYTMGSVGIGTSLQSSGIYPGNKLIVHGNTRITGEVKIGEGTIVLSPISGSIKSGDTEVVSGGGGASFSGIVTAAGFVGPIVSSGNGVVGTSLSISGISTLGITTITDDLYVAGVVTATSFVGDGSQLTGIDATALKDDGGNIKIQANSSGAVVTGVVTATSFVGDGSELTGIISGLWESNATGINTSTNIGIGTTTASSALTVDGDGRFTGVVSATTFRGVSGGNDAIFIGDGSGLTGITASGSGIVIRDDNNLIGIAGTINFGTNLDVSTISAGVVTVTSVTEVSGDTTPQLGGDLDGNSKSIYGVGVITATTFVKDSGTSSQFLKADGSVDSSTYLTSYSETSTLDNVLGRGNVSSVGLSVGVVTATTFVKDSGTSSQFLKADGSVDSSTYLTSYTETSTLDNVLGRGNISGIGLSVGVVTATSFVGDVTGTATTATNLADAANITTGIITSARLGSGASGTKFLRGDGTWQTVSTGGASGLWDSNATGINTSTNISIGTTTASSALTVTGDGKFTGVITATSFKGPAGGAAATFIGDGSGLTGITASGSGIVIKDSGSLVGTAGTIDFGDNLSVSVISGAAVTITASGGGVGSGGTWANYDNNTGVTTTKKVKIQNDLEVTGVVTATTFDGALATSDLTGTITNAQLGGSIANDKLANSSVSYGGVELVLGDSDATPAFDLSDATNYPYTSLTGVTTDIIGDTTPQLGGNLDGNSKDIYGVGIITATTFSGALTGNVTGTATTASGLSGTPNITVGNVTAADGTFSGNVSIAGTLTYEDVTNIDSVGLITARSGLLVGPSTGIGVTINTNGNASFAGIITATTFVGNLTGTASTSTSAATAYSLTGNIGDFSTRNITSTGIVTATSFKGPAGGAAATFIGDGSGLTGITASGSGIVIKDSSSLVGTAGTIDFGDNLSVSVISGAAVTITASGSKWDSNATGINTSTNVSIGTTTALSALTVSGDGNFTGVITATTFSGSGSSLTSIPNSALNNSLISYGGVEVSLGDSDATPAFDLSDATNYPYTSLTGVTTDIIGDTTPQLGGYLDLNSKGIYGTGIVTATSFVKDSGTSSQFLKADGSVDSSTYLTSYTETSTLDNVLGRGNVSSVGLSVGVVTATSFVGDVTGIATGATRVYIDETEDDNAVYNIVFSDVAYPDGGGDNYRTLQVDNASLTFNPGTNTLATQKIVGSSFASIEFPNGATSSGVITATTFSGALTGNVTGTATTATNLADGANITTGTIAAARLGSGVDAAKFLRGDNTWQTVSSGGGGASGLWESNATGINTSTNIGIGTTNASLATLTVDVGSATTAVVVQGSEGQLFSVTNSLSSGSIFSVNDISGIPSIDVDADGTIQLAPFSSTEFIGIGTTNPGMKLHVVGDATITGIVTATDINTTSDIRFKTNIQLIDNPINKIVQIDGVSFNWKSDNRPALGVIADQVEKILPQLVNGDDPKTVNYNGLIGLLIEVVKEQQTQIDSLKERISKLE